MNETPDPMPRRELRLKRDARKRDSRRFAQQQWVYHLMLAGSAVAVVAAAFVFAVRNELPIYLPLGLTALILLAAALRIRGRLATARKSERDRDAQIAAIEDALATSDEENNRRVHLKEEREDLERRIGEQARVRTFLSVAIVVGVISTGQFAFWYHNPDGYLGMAGVLIVLTAGWQVTRNRLRELEADLKQVDYEIAVVESGEGAKAETLFLKHQFDLKRYYDQTLRHGNLIFYVGVLALAVSLGIVVAAFAVIEQNPTETSVQIVVAILAAVGTFFTNSVALVYRGMHSAAIGAVTDFHERLVDDHELHFANLLLSQEPESEPVATARRRIGELIVETRRKSPAADAPGDP